MANPYFSFKKFTVYHDRCAMKVGTDGVLIGAWTKLNSGERILDVGAGSGLVSLMLAQRNANVTIDPIEIDEEASEQANENIQRAPFHNVSECRNISFQDLAATVDQQYDLIVSNPPFFARSLKSPDAQRSVARHTDSLFIEDFIRLSKSLLSPTGRISFIFPFQDRDYVLSLADENGLFVSRLTDVKPTPTSIPKRTLFELSVESCETQYEDLVVEIDRHVYSPQFIDLVQDFYLKY